MTEIKKELQYFKQTKGFPGGTVVKILPDSAGDTRDEGSIPGSGGSLGGGSGTQLQYSCLGNSLDRGAWWSIAHGVARSRTQLSHTQKQNPAANISLVSYEGNSFCVRKR